MSFGTEVLGATLCAEADATIDFARLLVKFTAAHFLFDAAAFDELAEATNGVLNSFLITHCKFDHD